MRGDTVARRVACAMRTPLAGYIVHATKQGRCSPSTLMGEGNVKCSFLLLGAGQAIRLRQLAASAASPPATQGELRVSAHSR